MKKFYSVLLFVLVAISAFAQSPEKFTYQAIVRDVSNLLVVNQQVGMQISILEGSESGIVVYSQTLTTNTNSNGLITIEIGDEIGWDAIDWGSATYFIKTDTDPAGGSNYTITGTSQLLSVPYALHSKTAESAANVFSGDYDDLSNTPDFSNFDQNVSDDFDGQYSSLIGSPFIPTALSDLTDDMGYLTSETDPVFTAWDRNTGISITESQISDLGAYLTAEIDPVFTAWDRSTGISITESQISDLGAYLTTEIDPVFTAWDRSTGISITESQISDLGAYLTTEIDPVFTAWDRSTGISITESQISDLGTYLTTEVDGSLTNEIQSISRSGLTVTLSNGGGSFQDSVNTYTAGRGIDITDNIVSSPLPDFYLGQDTLGGIVYYLYIGEDGEQHGLIISKVETELLWQNVAGTRTNGTRTWDGVYNMILMTDSPAKQWIASTFDSNWYLPAVDELSLLWQNRFHANKSLNDGGFTLISRTAHYWSSTEFNATEAYTFYFSAGYSNTYPKDSNVFTVRAVRAF